MMGEKAKWVEKTLLSQTDQWLTSVTFSYMVSQLWLPHSLNTTEIQIALLFAVNPNSTYKNGIWNNAIGTKIVENHTSPLITS